MLNKGYSQERKSNAGRKRNDSLILFKMIVQQQQLFNLSDEEFEFQVNVRSSFEEFVGLGVMNDIPDVTTVVFFMERPRRAGVIEEFFEIFEGYLGDDGLAARCGKSLMPLLFLSQNSITPERKTKTGFNSLPDGWEENPNRQQQKYLDARWLKKNGINHYGYKTASV